MVDQIYLLRRWSSDEVIIFILFLLGVEPHLKIQSSGDVILTETDLLPKLQEMKLNQTPQSEGYETMTQF